MQKTKLYSCKKINNYFNYTNISKLFKDYPTQTLYTKTSGGMQKCLFCTEDVARQVISNSKQSIKKKRIILNELFGDSIYPVKSYKESEFKDILEQTINGVMEEVEVLYQYKKGKYYVDFYIEALNLIIEFDEDYHNNSNQSKSDKLREKYIERLSQNFLVYGEVEIDTKIIRVKHDKIYKGLNEIIKYIIDYNCMLEKKYMEI